MKPYFSSSKCNCCAKRAMCYTYQTYKNRLREGATNYELTISNPNPYVYSII